MRQYLWKRSMELDKQPGIQYSQDSVWVFLCQTHTAHLRDPYRTPSESRVAPVNFGEVDHTDRELCQKIGPRTCRPHALVTQTDSLPGEADWWLVTQQKNTAWSPQTRGLLSRGLWKTKHRFVGMCVMDIHFTTHYCTKFDNMVKKRSP